MIRSEAGTGPQRLVQVDGLRAVAVTAVMVAHWFPERHLLGVGWGGLGVSLFFVISGYLITGILLDGRDAAAAAGCSRTRVAAAFGARRALRILPAYYGLLLVLAVTGNDEFWDHPLAYVMHLSNWVMHQERRWPGELSHLWSLALEEQFYLVWPLVVLFSPRAWLPRIVVAGIAVSALSTLDIVAAGGLAITPPAAFWGVQVGAGLALVLRARPHWLGVAPRLAGVLLAAFAAAHLLAQGDTTALGSTALRGLSLVAFAAVTAAAVRGLTGPVGRLLEQPLIQRVGRVSYGMYLVHNFVGVVDHPWLRFPLQFVLTWFLAELSFRLLEEPINRHKHRFPYVPRPPSTTQDGPLGSGSDRIDPRDGSHPGRWSGHGRQDHQREERLDRVARVRSAGTPQRGVAGDVAGGP